MPVTAEAIAVYREADARIRGSDELFCRTLVKIRDKGGKVQPFNWKRAQRELHERLERQKEETGKVRALVLKGRRMGISTYIMSRFKKRTILQTGHETFILTHHDDATKTLFEMVKFAHRRMHDDYKLATVRNNHGVMQFAGTESIYRVATAGGKEVGRSMNNQSFHGSEIAFWPNAESHFASAIETVPDARDTEVILESTANGVGGEFYTRWQQAEKNIGDYIAIFLPWFWDDDYRRLPPGDWAPPGEWMEYQELYGLDLDQVYWAFHRNIGLGGDESEIGYLFRQEYPGNAQEAFQTSSENTLIKAPAVIRARQTTLDLDAYEPLIFGIDIAATDGIPAPSATAKPSTDKKRRKGDSTRLISRQGRVLGRIDKTWRSDDSEIIADNIALEIREHRPDRVFIDITGIGWGLVGSLKRRGFKDIVTGVNFGEGATEDDKYKNKRAEMWCRMKEWFDEGPVDIPDSDSLHRELCAVTWKPDMRRRTQLEDKELIKSRLGFSPDGGDAAALTFAQIVTKAQKLRPSWVNEYKRDKIIDPMTR